MPRHEKLSKGKPDGVTEDRDSKGRFKKGNRSGIKFEPGNQYHCKYTEDMPNKVIEYFSREYMHSGHDATGKVYYWADRPPSFIRFALEIGVWPKTLYKWREEHPEFDEACKISEELAAQQLIDCGLNKAYNVTMAKFILSAKHGLVEKTAVDNNVKIEVELPEDINAEAD